MARWRADETWDWTRNRSAPCSALNGPNRRATPGVADTAAFEPGGMQLVDPARDELLADRCRVRLGEHVLDLVVGRRAIFARISDGSSYRVCTPSRLRIESPPSRASSPDSRTSTTASMAAARIGIPRSMPQNDWRRSMSSGSTVSVPGASETSSNP